MKNILKIVAFTYVACSSCAYAGSLEIKNETDSPVQIFLRAHNIGKPYQTTIVPKHQSVSLKIDRNQLGLTESRYHYDLIASTNLDSTIEPDWRLLAAECDNLSSANEETVVIEAKMGGLKTSCRVIKNINKQG
ncbi:MAG: hypothetical protein JNJ47_08630 [Alphaproteobacteria bacterium]|nr:hypothetical protein [Alphaproteobacteria bacterium]